jgi:hypothetical protein
MRSGIYFFALVILTGLTLLIYHYDNRDKKFSIIHIDEGGTQCVSNEAFDLNDKDWIKFRDNVAERIGRRRDGHK